MPFYDEFIRHGGVKKILNILLRYTKNEPQLDDNGQPINEAIEDHMDIHVRNIQFMEYINSKVFDREILKKEHRADGEMFDYQLNNENRDLHELLSEILRSLQTLTNRLSYRVVCDVRGKSCNFICYFKLFFVLYRCFRLSMVAIASFTLPDWIVRSVSNH